MKYNPKLINISLNGHQITQIKHTKFLGVFIDERPNWDEHVKQLSTKLSKHIGVLLKLKLYLITKFSLFKLINCTLRNYLSCP